jgi:protoporphyrinogen oxidase
MSGPMKTADVLIIGAGPAGLTAGYLLAKAGKSVVVIERDPVYVGGISRTARHGDFRFDIGGHRFFSKSREVVDLWNEILPNDFIDRPRLSRIYFGGKYYSYPLRAFEALANLGILTSAGCVLSYAWARIAPVKNANNFHQWVRNQFGEKLFSIFFKTYTEKVWGMSCDDISADWAAQRIKGLSLGTALINAVARSLGLSRKPAASLGEQGGVKTLLESFRYPRLGPGMMWEAAAAKLKALGGECLMGRSLSSLRYDNGTGSWTVEAAGSGGEREYIEAKHVISSAPIRELVAAIEPRPDCCEHAHALRYRDFMTVVLIAPAAALKKFPDNWIYIHDPGVKVGRIQNFLSWSPAMAPEGYACIGLEYFCFEGDALWTMPDDALGAMAREEIGKIGLIAPGAVTESVVVRQPKAYPIYDDLYQDRIAAIRNEFETKYPSLHLVGRNGMHKYNNQDHAMMTAMLTAENIIAGRRVFNVWSVNEDAEYTEAGNSGADTILKDPARKDGKVETV